MPGGIAVDGKQIVIGGQNGQGKNAFSAKKNGEKLGEKTVKIFLPRAFHLGTSEGTVFIVPQRFNRALAGNLLSITGLVNNVLVNSVNSFHASPVGILF